MNGSYRHSPWFHLIWRWGKFNVVGGAGVLVQLAVLYGLVGILGMHYLPATLLAVEAAILHNFCWHERWTWSDRTRHHPGAVLHRLVAFNVTTGLTSLLGNLVFMFLLVDQMGLHYLMANLLAIAACSLFNFLVSDRFIFRPATLPPVPATGSEESTAPGPGECRPVRPR
ncbi:MAG: GtrA family protein [Acidobacteria bacterium]|nr:GtrA family protein [Acidobacteriota bacterium]